jgi:hypothetical protein
MTPHLWVFLAALHLHRTAILQKNHMKFEVQGLATLNALMLAKIMMIADDRKLGDALRDEGGATLGVPPFAEHGAHRERMTPMLKPPRIRRRAAAR